MFVVCLTKCEKTDEEGPLEQKKMEEMEGMREKVFKGEIRQNVRVNTAANSRSLCQHRARRANGARCNTSFRFFCFERPAESEEARSDSSTLLY